MTRITLANGTVIEVSDGVTIPSWALSLIAQGQAVVTVSNGHAHSATPVQPAPASVGTGDADMVELFRHGLGISPSAPSMPVIIGSDDPPAPAPATPQRLVYLTDVEWRALVVLRQFPEGISSKDVADLMEVTHSSASSAVWRLANKRPIEDSKYPLARKISGGRWRCTPLGAKIKVLTSLRPDRHNQGLGWI